MSVAAAISDAPALAPAFDAGSIVTFDPQDYDDITASLVNAETIHDQHLALIDQGKRRSELAQHADVAGVMAAFMVARHKRGHETTKDHMLMLGWTNREIEVYGATATGLARRCIAEGEEALLARLAEEEQERMALFEAQCCTHADGEG